MIIGNWLSVIVISTPKSIDSFICSLSLAFPASFHDCPFYYKKGHVETDYDNRVHHLFLYSQL